MERKVEMKEKEKKIRIEKTDEKPSRPSFLRLLGKYDFRNEEQFREFGKWLTFVVLVIVEGLILLEHLNNFIARGGTEIFIAIIVLITVLTTSEALRLFAIKSDKGKAIFFAIDALGAGLFVFVTSGTYPVLLYLIVLTGFYLNTDRTKSSVVMFACAVFVYAVCYSLKLLLDIGGASVSHWIPVFTEAFGSGFIFVVHYLIVQVALAFYRQYLKLNKALKELDESKKELQKAYDAVAEVTALEERQRIAKEIHDTAGHSITTVIMQTETAKLIVDKDPWEAKQKIISANLQAKHALEELRDSVHLLSGISENQTLKTALESILHDSTDGTGITIRSAIEDIELASAKSRFLCNTLKEGISNGLRHGNATAFWFELKKTGNKVEFLLSDNGKGIDTETVRTGFGLSTMRERAKSLGGEIKFRSETDEGFEIFLTIPC